MIPAAVSGSRRRVCTAPRREGEGMDARREGWQARRRKGETRSDNGSPPRQAPEPERERDEMGERELRELLSELATVARRRAERLAEPLTVTVRLTPPSQGREAEARAVAWRDGR